MTSVLTEQRLDESAINELTFSSRKTPDSMHYRMVICANCDLAYANPAPDIGWLRKNYIKASYETAEESNLAAANHSRLLDRVLHNLPDRDGALDIGTGDGAFLKELLNRGFTNVEGVEPSINPIQEASDEVNKLITPAFFEGDNYESNSFSVVTCFQVLEHVDQIDNLVKSVFRLLKPGGYFLTVGHDHRAWTARLLGQRSPIFDIEHLQLLSRTSFRHMYNKHNFQKFKVASMTNSYPLNYWVKLSPLPKSARRSMSIVLKSLKLNSLRVPLRAGNLWALGVKPN